MLSRFAPTMTISAIRRSSIVSRQRLALAGGCLGAALLLAADTVSRLLVAPAELPIGIVMALIGAPVFLWILLQRRGIGMI